MPRYQYNGLIQATTDAQYRALLQSIEDAMVASGLVRTSDTGQINPATAVRVASTDIGYSMWRFADSLQSVSPIFIKLIHRINSNVSYVGARWEVGDGSDGAGNLTGLTMSSGNLSPVFNPANATLYDSYVTHSAGFFGFAHGVGIQGTYNSPYNCAIQRTVDNNGLPTGEGVVMTVAGQTNSYGQVYRKNLIAGATGVVNYSAQYQGLVPGNMLSTNVGLDPQLFLHFTAMPKVKPLVGTASYVTTDIPIKTQIQTTLLGTAPRNYIAVGDALAYSAAYAGNSAGTTRTAGLLMLWEV